METNFTLSIVVRNRFGVLTRISGLFSKRGFNIDTLTANPVDGTENTHIVLSSYGDEATKEQIIKQLSKLQDVENVELVAN